MFGSLLGTFDYVQDISFPAYTGCIRNVQINGELLDFSDPLAEVSVIEGCLCTGCEPNPPCKNGGRCAGYWGTNFVCDCTPRFAGQSCDKGMHLIVATDTHTHTHTYKSRFRNFYLFWKAIYSLPAQELRINSTTQTSRH